MDGLISAARLDRFYMSHLLAIDYWIITFTLLALPIISLSLHPYEFEFGYVVKVVFLILKSMITPNIQYLKMASSVVWATTLISLTLKNGVFSHNKMSDSGFSWHPPGKKCKITWLLNLNSENPKHSWCWCKHCRKKNKKGKKKNKRGNTEKYPHPNLPHYTFYTL